MVEIARLFVFVAFACLAGYAAQRRSRGAVNLFLAYTIVASVAIGVTQLDAWPFSTYRLANQSSAGKADVMWVGIRFFGVDSHGREWSIDPQAWAPIHLQGMESYMHISFASLDESERRELGRFLLEHAEADRRALYAGRYFGNERLLGPFSAPDWSLYERHREAASDPYVAIRVVREFWMPKERLRDPHKYMRQIVLEYRG